jgi:hypothetical protein
VDGNITANGTGTQDFTAGTLKFDTINIPTSSSSSTYGVGTAGQVLKSNGSKGVYWANDHSIATTSAPGLVKPSSVIAKPTINTVSAVEGKYYHVQMSSDGNMFVNVPWRTADNIDNIVDIEYRLTG